MPGDGVALNCVDEEVVDWGVRNPIPPVGDNIIWFARIAGRVAGVTVGGAGIADSCFHRDSRYDWRLALTRVVAENGCELTFTWFTSVA